MLWDVFCRVIDNFGDIGVCWRLASDLAQRGQRVRLWVDDASALQWMAPDLVWRTDSALGLTTGQGVRGITVFAWADAIELDARCPDLQAGDVVVEAFGCDPPDAFIARMQARAARGEPAQWVNLEYLSAETYVERSHGLRSPVWSGPGAGLSKRFFYPGFTPATGGLIREPGLIGHRTDQTASPAQASALLQAWGVPIEPAEAAILIFCYDSAPVDALLDHLAARHPQAHVLTAPGQATTLASRWQASHQGTPLRLHALPHLSQADFDRLLWCTQLNFVRGEDSAVRALWAGRPHVWHIYEQDDGVHGAKLEAFMARWMADWPAPLRAHVRAWWLAWNRLGPMPDTLPDWADANSGWWAASRASRAKLLGQNDLTSQLINFVTSSG